MSNPWTDQNKFSQYLVDENGGPLELPSRSPEKINGEEWALKASYDIYHRYQNDDHFKYSTLQSDEAINTRELRHAIAKLVRYEFRNNLTFKSFVYKWIHSVIRTGPKLGITPRSSTKKAAKAAQIVEENWQEHTEDIDLPNVMALICQERILAGEGFGVFSPNPQIPDVEIDIKTYEMEQFSDPHSDEMGILYGNRFNSEYPPADGIFYDNWGNPEKYHRLRYHPGGTAFGSVLGTYGIVSYEPSRVFHWFKKERPTTRRGMSEGADCIETLGKLRRLDESILNTLEKESKILASMETNLPFGQATEISSGGRLTWNWAGAQVTSTPQGWKMVPWNHSHGKVQSYREVKDELKREIAARFLLPWNVATSSEDFNFASARIDTIIFEQVVDIVRKELERKLLKRYFRFWFDFAVLVSGLIPDGLGQFRMEWFWPEKQPLDQMKQAKADETYAKMGQFSEIDFWKSRGRDAKKVYEEKVQLAKAKKDILATYGMESADVEKLTTLQDMAGSPSGNAKEEQLELDAVI